MNTTNPHVARECDRSDETCALNPQSPSSSSSSEAERDDYAPHVDLPDAVVDSVAHYANYWPLTHGEIGESFYRFAQELKNEVIARLPRHCFTRPTATPPSLPIDFKQASELLAMFGGEAGEVTLHVTDGHSGKGLYAHYTEYPEEGAEFLGATDGWAVPTEPSPHPEEGALLLGGDEGGKKGGGV